MKKAIEKKPLYIYSLASRTELKELKEIGKEWKDVGIVSILLGDTNESNPESLGKLGGEILAKLIEHNNKK